MFPRKNKVDCSFPFVNIRYQIRVPWNLNLCAGLTEETVSDRQPTIRHSGSRLVCTSVSGVEWHALAVLFEDQRLQVRGPRVVVDMFCHRLQMDPCCR
jgi:hypothetical protein